MIFISFISFVILLRTGELLLSKRNEQWLRQHGAIEYGNKHYKFIVAIHVLYFCALIIEYVVRPHASFNAYLLLVYCFLLLLKTWIVLSLGKFWTTKIYRIPNVPLVRKGPYKYFKHPNYFVVVFEILVIPLIFSIYYTAIIFTLLNAIVLFVRIKEENKALRI